MDLRNDIRYLAASMKRVFNTLPSVVQRREPIQRAAQLYYRRGLQRGAQMYHPGAANGILQGDWSSVLKPVSEIIRSDLKKLCARSELAYRTDAIFRRAINLLTTFVVGQGNKPYPAVKYANGEPVEGINRQLSADWERFNDQGMRNGTVDMTMYHAQALEFATIAVYGSSLTNVVNSRNGSWLPYAFQLLKPHRLDFAKDSSFLDSEKIKQGVRLLHGMKINEFAEPLSFFFENDSVEYPSSRISLAFYPIETEQYLGLPWGTPVLPQVWDHQQLFDDKMKQSRIGARLGVRMPKDDQEAVQSLLDTNSDGQEYFDLDFQGFYFSKGKPEPISITDPLSETFEPLVKRTLGMIALGFGFSYQLFTSDLAGANFSSSRANIITDNKAFRTLYKWFTKTTCQKRWEKFVQWEVQTGRLLKYGVGLSEYENDPWYYNQCFWLPMDGEDWVDPLKDQQALLLAYKMGQLTYQELCAMRGKHWRSVARQLKAERQYFREENMEFMLPENISSSPKAAGAQVEPEQEMVEKEGEDDDE